MQMTSFIDSHIHLQAAEYSDVLTLLNNARLAGVKAWIIPGTTLDDQSRQLALRAQYSNCFNAFGYHPWFLDALPENWKERLQQAIENDQPIAIGECGLDFSRDHQALQKTVFEAHVKMAADFKLPLIIHSYKAVDQVLKILRQYPTVTGVFHAFNGSLQQLDQLLALGYYVGFGGAVTYPRAKRLQSLLAATPLDRLLIETDGPYQAGAYAAPHEIHYPTDLVKIAHFIAEQKSLACSELAKITTENAINLFNLELK